MAWPRAKPTGSRVSRLRRCNRFGGDSGGILYSLFVESDYNVPAEFSEISFFEDSYARAAQGTYGSRQDVYDQLLEFTGRFKDDA